MHLLSAICATLLVSRSAAQYQIYNLTTESTKLSATCVGVLNQAQNCDSAIEWAGYGGRYEANDILSTLCTQACTASLTTWLKRASGACTMRYVDEKGNAIHPAYYVEKILENYNLLCLKNGDKFCNTVVRDAVGIDPDDQSQTKSAASTVTCDDCFLRQIQTRLQMPLQSNSDLAKTFTSLTSVCKKTGLAVTPIATSTAWITSGTPTASDAKPTPSTCVGTTITLRSGDTCQSLALARGISVAGLLTANGLPAYCVNFPTSGTLCLPAIERCRVYAVQTGDTCEKIADANKLTWAQIVSWNPSLGLKCENIRSYVGYAICVATPGGVWVNPDPTSPSPSTDASTIVITGTPAGQLPKPTETPSGNASDSWVYKFAPLTRLDCIKYANGSNFGPSAACNTVAKGFGVEETDLVLWNPSLQASCNLDGGLTYCVQKVVRNFTSDMTPYCTLQDIAIYNMRCDQFLAVWGMDAHRLDDLNPGVGKNCENWKYGHNYCVAAPHFKPAGYAPNCNKFATSENMDRLTDSCTVLETEYGLSHARFVAWNPSVLQNCTGIVYGYDYCVSIPGYKPTYTSYINTFKTITPSFANGMGVMGGMEEATATASVTKEASGNGNTMSASGNAMGESGTIISGGKTTGTTSGASSSITGAPKHKRHDHEHLHRHGL